MVIDGNNDEARHDPPNDDLRIDDEAKNTEDLTRNGASRARNDCGRITGDAVASIDMRSGLRLTQSMLRSLHAVGMTDFEISAARHVDLPFVIRMRIALGLPVHPQTARDVGDDQLTLLRVMHDVGCDDVGIALALHITEAEVAALRGKWELAANPSSPAIEDGWMDYVRGWLDADIARAAARSPRLVVEDRGVDSFHRRAASRYLGE